ncbi:MAG TPA: hypothetical protein VK181_19510 [Rhizobium sp.]|nr:hypothetical protein [Rhizobium sp.]
MAAAIINENNQVVAIAATESRALDLLTSVYANPRVAYKVKPIPQGLFNDFAEKVLKA